MYGTFIYNSQNHERIQMYLIGWMVKQISRHLYHGIPLFGNKKKQTIDIENLRKCLGNYAEWKIIDSKWLHTIYNILKVTKMYRWKTNCWFPGVKKEIGWEESWGSYKRQHEWALWWE